MTTKPRSYGIKRRDTGQYWSGFDGDGNPTWGGHGEACVQDYLSTRCQASLFRCLNIPVINEPQETVNV